MIAVGDETNSALLERAFLQSLCAIDARARSQASSALTLAKYVWWDQDNQIVFEALNQLSLDLSPLQLREQLPAQATRMGFPEVIWTNYFPPNETVAANIQLIIDQLVAACPPPAVRE